MSGTGLVQSLARGLDILQAVARSDNGLRLNEIASAMGLKPPTAHSLAKTLASRGFLSKARPGPRYTLGPAALEMADWRRKRSLARRAAREVARLFDDVGMTVTYAEPVGGELAVRLRMSPDRPGVLQEPEGFTFRPYTSASLLAYLAHCTEEERETVRRRYPFIEYGAHAWKTEASLESFIEEVRRKGYAAPEWEDRDIFHAAAPVFGAGRALVATLGVSARSKTAPGRERRDAIVRRLVQAAASLSGRE